MVTYGKRRLLAAFALTTVGAVVLAGCSGGSEPETEDESGPVTLTLTTNSITGGKNSAEADWIADWVIPEFEKAMDAEGKDVTVEFQPQGVDDEDYKTKIALDLQSGKGADIIGMDGIWVGEFAEAGYIKPLSDVGGKAVDDWDGWAQIPDAVQNALSFDGDRYGVPQGADGRVLYYNKDLFAQAGLDEDWAPESWDDILDAARDLKDLDGVTPIQLNAGTAMGEATTMQGLLPMLVGTGEQVYEDGKWIGATDGMEKTLDLYETIYVDEGLGDPVLQQEASGRDTSFQLFAEGKIGILLEGDYFWRSVINPAEGVGTAPMADRDTTVGYAKIPAIEPGDGINDQDYVSMSGGTGRVLNPNSKHAALAWELLAFMNSPEAYEARAAGTLSISPRNDVNEKLLSSDPMLTFVSEEVLPITAYRPGLAAYPQVSVLLQQATLDVATGTSVDDALKTYVRGLEGVVGPDAISE
ncbi:MAG: extracellular solute-binding protein [Rhodoglobus sp.]|uniref:sugar ABC transporter substrate-binding protein n=1 Tax=Microbacterium TaxID=33882 RepID=UPI00106AED9F|nr:MULTISPECIES: extracellular solute-binding protein [Microbacterium]MCZ4301857.1 extracellular solute-binding protein [Microbacterium oxydans]MDZ4046562.1 extracellular solute-binding protein [Rhodoglobus sp.]QEA27545.1 extracellular solute-binding protein [Microbacterium sp. CBA3102]TFB16147.1 extracellular solute-binding protein [Microbacterium sp. 3H14]